MYAISRPSIPPSSSSVEISPQLKSTTVTFLSAALAALICKFAENVGGVFQARALSFQSLNPQLDYFKDEGR